MQISSTPSAFAYVTDAAVSAALYARLFGAEPVDSSPHHAMFAFPTAPPSASGGAKPCSRRPT